MKKNIVRAVVYMIAMLSLVTWLVFREVKRIKENMNEWKLLSDTTLTVIKVDSLSNDSTSVYQIK